MQAGVGFDELLHLVGVSGHDDHKPVAVVFHAFQERCNCLSTIVLRAVALGERISFVDEKHSVERRVAEGVDAWSRLAHILADEPRAVGFNQMAFLEHSEVLIDSGNDSGNGGFTSSRTSCEHQMERQFRRLQPFLLAHLLHFHIVGQRTDFFFHFLQADELVEFLIGVAFNRLVHHHAVFVFSAFLAVFFWAESVFPSLLVAAVVVDFGHEFLVFFFVFGVEHHRHDAQQDEDGCCANDDDGHLLGAKGIVASYHFFVFLIQYKYRRRVGADSTAGQPNRRCLARGWRIAKPQRRLPLGG